MENFPNEVLDNIVKNLDNNIDDLCRVRLVCQSFNKVAEPYLFRDLTVWLHSDSLERLVKVAKSHLRRHVISLTIGMESVDHRFNGFYDYVSFLHQQWLDKSFKVRSHHQVNPLADHPRALRGWAAWRQLFIQEHLYRNGFICCHYFAAAFSKLSNLQTVVFAGDETLQRSPPKLSWGVQRVMDSILTSPLYMAHRLDSRRHAGRQLVEVIHGAAAVNARFRNLEIWDVEISSARGITSLNPWDLSLAARAFKNVRNLLLESPLKCEDPGDEVVILPIFLTMLQGLETICWSGPRNDQKTEDLLFPEIMAHAHRFQYLRALDLKDLHCSENSFLAMLRRYRHTLRVLRIHDMQLDGGEFYSLFPKMRQILNLNKFSISGMLEQWTELPEDKDEWHFITTASNNDREVFSSIVKFVMRTGEDLWPTNELFLLMTLRSARNN